MAYFCRQGWVFVILLSGPAAFQDVIVVNRKNTEVNTMFPNPLEDESDQSCIKFKKFNSTSVQGIELRGQFKFSLSGKN